MLFQSSHTSAFSPWMNPASKPCVGSSVISPTHSTVLCMQAHRLEGHDSIHTLESKRPHSRMLNHCAKRWPINWTTANVVLVGSARTLWSSSSAELDVGNESR
jgi:hypothetical protein